MNLPASEPCSRRTWLQTAAALLAPRVASGKQEKRPNIVLIMSDDQGYGDFGFHGNPHLRTPNLDRLAGESTEFTRFYVSPVCAPTRASLLTGRYNLRAGVHGVTGGRETMRTGETTIAEALRAAGYRTGLVGKWHLGEHYPYVPHGQGFDEFLGFRTGHWTNYFDTGLERNGQPVETRGYMADVLTDEAIAFLERNRARPFFLYLAYNTPHSPYQVPEESYSRFRKSALPEDTKAVYAMVENLDRNVGRLLAALDKSNLSKDTLVLFLSDNGPAGQRYNAGLRGAKGSVYEGGVRTPLLARWPSRIPSARKVDTLAAHIDIFPTLLEICGAKSSGAPVDGTSLTSLLFDRKSAWPGRMIYTHRDGNQSKLYPGSVRTQQFNLINGEQLYDIEADPGEKTDVSAQHPGRVKSMRAAYETWYAEVSKQCGFEHVPIPVGHAQENPVVLPATQASFDGELHFRHENGYAHDWIAGWNRPQDSVWWEIDVARAGVYRVSARYLCPEGATGSKVAVQAGEQQAQVTVDRATPMQPVPNQNRIATPRYADMTWGTLPFGSVKLPAGKLTIKVKVVQKGSGAVMELKDLWLFRVS